MAQAESGAHCSCALVTGQVEQAASQAAVQALDALDSGSSPSLAIVEVCSPGDPDSAGRALALAARAIADAAPGCSVIGSSAHGVIGAAESAELRPAVSVWVAALPGERPRGFRLAAVPGPGGGAAVKGLPDLSEQDRLGVLLVDPWSLPVDDVVGSFARVDGALPVVGGLVSGARRGESRLMLDGAVFGNGAVGVILGAQAPVRAVVSQGCRPIGHPMTVTESHGNALVSLAGRPALERVRDAVSALDPDDQALAVRGLHVGIAHEGLGDGSTAADYVVRGIIGVDSGSGAIAVGDEVPVGSVVRLHLRDADSADADLREVVSAIGGDAAVGAYLFTCNGRGSAMFTSADHDAAIVRAGLGSVPVGGFFAAGEIGPVGGANHLHGFTAVVLVVDATTVLSDVEIFRDVGASASPSVDLDAELRSLLDPDVP